MTATGSDRANSLRGIAAAAGREPVDQAPDRVRARTGSTGATRRR